MTRLFGHDRLWQQFSASLESGKLHHGWILAGPRGVGKGAFALRAASAVVDAEGRYQNLIERGSHPDIITVRRLAKETAKDGDDGDSASELKRSITIEQVRNVQGQLTTRPGLSDKRVIIIDPADDLERNGANALLKSLEEPPVGTYFLLISHASDRLLPTIRSRCRMLRFDRLNDADMASALQALTGAAAEEIAALVHAANGSPGQAVDFLGLDLGKLEEAMTSIIDTGDQDNALRSAIASQLASKAAQPRFEAFLRRAPSLIAERARRMPASDVLAATDAWHAAAALANRAVALSLDKQSVVLQMSSLLASLQPHKAAR